MGFERAGRIGLAEDHGAGEGRRFGDHRQLLRRQGQNVMLRDEALQMRKALARRLDQMRGVGMIGLDLGHRL